MLLTQVRNLFRLQPRSLPLDEAMERWFRHIEAQRKGREVVRQCRRDLVRHFGPRPLDRIAPQEIVEVVEHVRDTYGPGSAEHLLSYTGRFYRWAQARGLATTNPAQGLTCSAIVGPRPSRERVLSEGELAAVWNATTPLDGHDRIIRLLMLTGCRRSEIGSLEGSEINYRDRQIELPARKVKNGKPHIVPLSEAAMDLLPRSRPARQFIFGRTGRAPFSGWSRCKERLDARSGVKDWIVHDLRRTCVTMCNERQLSTPWIIEAFVNHISGAAKGGVAGTYNRAQWLAERRELAGRWADELARIVSS